MKSVAGLGLTALLYLLWASVWSCSKVKADKVVAGASSGNSITLHQMWFPMPRVEKNLP